MQEKNRIKDNYIYMRLLIFAVGLAFLAVHIISRQIFYESADDTVMNLISAGAYGKDTSHLVFVGIIPGKIISLLYHFMPGVNCYMLFFLFMNLAAITLTCFVVCDILTIDNIYAAGFVSLCVNLLFDCEAYTNLQFTRNASIYSAVGMMLILYGAFKKKNGYTVIGAILAMFGLMTRSESFIAVLPFFFAAFAYILFDEIVLSKKEDGKAALKGQIISFILVMAFFATTFFINKMAYSSDEWKYHKEYNDNRAHILDYTLPDYEKNKARYDEIGITKADYEMFAKWNYADTDVFTLEKVKEICALRMEQENTGLRINKGVIKATVINIWNNKKYTAVPIFLIVFMFMMIKGDLFLRLFTIVETVLVGGEVWYLTCIGRIRWRAMYGLFLAAILLLPIVYVITVLKRNDKALTLDLHNKKTVGVLAIVFAFCLVICIYGLQTRTGKITNENLEDDKKLMDMFADLTGKEDKFFVIDTQTDVHMVITDILKINKDYEGRYANSQSLGGWTVPAPIYDSRKRFNMDNPVKSLACDDNVYLISSADNEDVILDYVREHYNPGAEITIVDSFDDIKIMSFNEKARSNYNGLIDLSLLK